MSSPEASPRPATHSKSTGKIRKKRRDSVATETGLFTRDLEESLEKLRRIWDRVGFSDAVRGERVATFYAHLRGLLKEMVSEEKEMANNLCDKIEKYDAELVRLCRDLHCERPDTKEEELPMIELEERLRKITDDLTQEKHQRLTRQKELSNEDIQLCERLDMEPYYVPDDVVPTTEQLENLDEHVRHMNSELKERREKFDEDKRRVMSIMRRLNYVPSESFEKEVLEVEDGDFIFSTNNLLSLRTLRDQMEVKLDEFLAELRSRIQSVKKELEEWWDKCHVTTEERQALPNMDEENFSEEALDAYKKEVKKWKNYYQERQAVLGKVDMWETLWREKVEFERREHDPTRYTNRRGELEKELKRARRVEEVLLPRAWEEIMEAMSAYSRLHPLEPLLVNGTTPQLHILQVQEEHRRAKEKEKEMKVQEKRRQLENETRFGTPSNRLMPSPSPKKRGRKETPVPSGSKIRIGLRFGNPNPAKMEASPHPRPTPYSRPVTRGITRVGTGGMAAGISSPVGRPPKMPTSALAHKDHRPVESRVVGRRIEVSVKTCTVEDRIGDPHHPGPSVESELCYDEFAGEPATVAYSPPKSGIRFHGRPAPGPSMDPSCAADGGNPNPKNDLRRNPEHQSSIISTHREPRSRLHPQKKWR